MTWWNLIHLSLKMKVCYKLYPINILIEYVQKSISYLRQYSEGFGKSSEFLVSVRSSSAIFGKLLETLKRLSSIFVKFRKIFGKLYTFFRVWIFATNYVGKNMIWSWCVALEWFSVYCSKTKTKAITMANHNKRKHHNEPMRTWRKYTSLARENACGQVAIGFRFSSDWLIR